ncbi:MAG: alpha/beta hydrolase [Rhodopseudomonas palustris]|uniref:Alpha/beta hydrolase n=1 Tax=Rhodopseudomonas palustris TaxID=1076 RepID=A0A933RTJ8_RHOPL|nr:alpha/beta hydrolase [Rhodopseudomonas palustris]
MTWRSEQIAWAWDDKPVNVAQTWHGDGPTVLMLPALSSISTRREMRPLQQQLGGAFRTVAIDWPGFGDLPRPKIDWRPETYHAFLKQAAERIRPAATIAVGHAAGYALAAAAEAEGTLGALSLISPTWRGPLPTMAGRRLAAFGSIARAVDWPVLGALLYRLNVNRPVIGMMARGHVYADPAWLTPERLRDKLAVTEAPGARYASVRFVAGELDAFVQRVDFLAAAARLRTPLQVVYGAQAPRKSKADMVALAALDHVDATELPVGKLSVYEEYPEVVAPVVAAFLRSHLKTG